MIDWDHDRLSVFFSLLVVDTGQDKKKTDTLTFTERNTQNLIIQRRENQYESGKLESVYILILMSRTQHNPASSLFKKATSKHNFFPSSKPKASLPSLFHLSLVCRIYRITTRRKNNGYRVRVALFLFWWWFFSCGRQYQIDIWFLPERQIQLSCELQNCCS